MLHACVQRERHKFRGEIFFRTKRPRIGRPNLDSDWGTGFYLPTGPAKSVPVPIYRSGLAGNRSVPVEFKFEFKKLSSTGSYRYTGRFEFKSKFKIACVTGLERYTGRFDRFTKWALMGRLIFFFSFLV